MTVGLLRRADRPPCESTQDGPESRPTGDAWHTLRLRFHRVRALVRKEVRQIFRDPRSRRIVFAAPVLQLLLFGYAVNTDVHRVATYVVDHDRTMESRALVDALTAGGYFRVVGRSDRPAAMTDALDAGKAVVALEIPRGFARDLGAGRGARVQLLLDGTNSNTATVAQGYATRIVQQFGARYAAAAGGSPGSGADLRARALYNPDLASRVYNIPAVAGTILMLMSLLLTSLSVVRERELGTLDQLVVSPITPGELILGKTIPVAAIALIDLALIAGIGTAWFDVPFRGHLATLALGAGLFVLASLGLGLLISTISRTQQEAFMTLFLFFLPAIVLSGFLYPVDTMPAFFRALTLANPLRHFLEFMRALFLEGAGTAELWPQLTAVGLTAVAVLRLATWRFRRTYG